MFRVWLWEQACVNSFNSQMEPGPSEYSAEHFMVSLHQCYNVQWTWLHKQEVAPVLKPLIPVFYRTGNKGTDNVSHVCKDLVGLSYVWTSLSRLTAQYWSSHYRRLKMQHEQGWPVGAQVGTRLVYRRSALTYLMGAYRYLNLTVTLSGRGQVDLLLQSWGWLNFNSSWFPFKEIVLNLLTVLSSASSQDFIWNIQLYAHCQFKNLGLLKSEMMCSHGD